MAEYGPGVGAPPNASRRCVSPNLVNLARVERLSGNVLLVGTHEIPVGSTYRQEVLRQLQLR